jgi:hypothetical protein
LETLNKVEGSGSATPQCITDMVSFIPNKRSLQFICEKFATHEEAFRTSHIIKYFLACLRPYYEPSSAILDTDPSRYRVDLADMLLVKDVDLVLSEMQQCVNRWFKPDRADTAFLAYQNLKDFASLSENSNFLHRPALDMNVLAAMPHANLQALDSIDVLVGITAHESFYFLFHDFNINDMLLHTFVYASLINKTENLLIKLSEIHQNKALNLCLKKRLFGFYQLEMSDEQLARNSLRNNTKSLELISDYDFVLPLVTQLKFQLENARSNNNKRRLFVYEYSHATSINYLMDYLLTIGNDYSVHAKKYGNKVSPHFSELDFMFGLPFLSKAGLIRTKNNVTGYKYDYTSQETELSERMMDYWSNFAKYGQDFYLILNQI